MYPAVLDMIVNVRDIKYFGIYKLQWPILTAAAYISCHCKNRVNLN